MTAQLNIPIIFNKIRKGIAHQYEEEIVGTLLQALAQKLHTKSPIRRIEIGVDYPKNRDGHVKNFSVTLALDLNSGSRFVAHGYSPIAKAKGVGLGNAIREAFADIEAQYRKRKR